MANKLLNTREMQIKTTTAIRITTNKSKKEYAKYIEDLQQLQIPQFVGRNKKWYNLFKKLLDTFLYT